MTIAFPPSPTGIDATMTIDTTSIEQYRARQITAIPDTIRVRITGQAECREGRYDVVSVPFKDYVKGVLGNEMGPDWPEDALRAGAVAVKMCAWSYIADGGKWHDADVYDCDWDQVYDPSLTFPETDRAVEDTWGVVMLDGEGFPYRAHHLAYMGGCDITGVSGKCMGQWDAKRDAEAGMDWRDILQKYYEGVRIVEE